MNVDSFCFVEHADFSLRLVRCGGRKSPLRIEEIKEVSATDPAAVTALVRGVVTTTDGLVCSLRPRLQRLHLAGAGEAKQYPGASGVEAFLRLSADAATNAAWLTAADAARGAEPSAAGWLVAATSTAAYEAALGTLAAVQLKPAPCTSAVFGAAGALMTGAKGAVLLLEIGAEQSHALLVDRSGVRAVAPVGLNRDRIAEVVQVELGLKFRGSAGKLFFNPDYDFSEVATKLAARIAEGLKPELAPLLAGVSGPVELYCPSLPLAQQWLVAPLAGALGLAPHVPDVRGWCSAAGVTFADPAVEAGLAPTWFGALYSANAVALAGSMNATWQPEWRALGAASAAPATPAPAAAPAPKPETAKPAPASVPPAKPAPAPVQPVKPAPAPAAPAAPAAKPTPPAASAKPVLPPIKPVVPAPAPAKKGVPAPATPAPKSEPVKPAPVAAKPTPAPAAKPEPAKPVPTPSAAKPVSSVSLPGASTSEAKAQAGKQRMMLIGAAAAVVVVLLGLFFYQSQKSEKTRLAEEKQATEQRLQAERERVRLAEEKARQEAESRKKTEIDLAQKLAQAESARQQAEEEARNQAAARMANARGTVEIVTEPAGATVKVGNLPPRTSPATFSDIKTGRYPVAVTMARYAEVRFDVEVKENATTAPAPVQLVRLVGQMELTTDPAGVDYEVRPANQLMVDPASRLTGRTPAKLDDLSPGEYAVTLTREGWAPHSETVTVERDGVAKVNWSVPTGALKITSNVPGAVIRRKGVEIGTAPLTLKEQAPGPVELEVSLADYLNPVELRGELTGGRTLELAARFPADDRVYAAAELDKEPEAIAAKKISIPYYLTLEKPRLELELIVDRDGASHRLRVIKSSSPDLVKHVVNTVSQWTFKPGERQGRPVNARVVLTLASFVSEAR